MSYIGSTPTTQSFIAGTDYFNGTGSATAFTLSRSVVSVNDIQATVNNVVQQPNDAYTISGTTITFTSAPSAGTNNIYVRYLSTTTQSITPSQGTVSNSSFGNVTAIPFVAGPSLGAGNASIMKNRIINGAMVIDQRNAGASVTQTTSGLYTLDRWQTYGVAASKFTIQQSSTAPTGFVNSTLITSTSSYSVAAGDFFVFQQAVEGYNTADLGWGTADAKTVTLSFQVRSSLTGTFSGAITNSANTRSYPFTYTISSANTWTPISITIAGDTSGTWLTTNGIGLSVRFSMGAGSTYSTTANAWASSFYTSATGATSVVGTNGATFYITGVQLEVGSSATGFEYVNYQTSLANCQRYFQRLGSYAGGYTAFGSGRGGNSTTVVCYFKYTTTVRATPTISQSNTAINYPTQSAVTGFGSIYYGTDSAGVELTNANTVASGTAVVWLGNNSSSAYVDISAEL
jgi:hypothetical protein